MDEYIPMTVSKKEAIAIVNGAINSPSLSPTTHFAHVNARKPVWWFDIAVDKFVSGKYEHIDLLTITGDEKTIHHLRVPTKYVGHEIASFHVRIDKKSVSLELSTDSSNLFQDVRPGGKKMPFIQFLVTSLPITSPNAACSSH